MTIWAGSKMKAELPSLAVQNAFLVRGTLWKATARPTLRVEYGDEIEWYAVQTNPRCEHRAMVTLGEKGFISYFPKGRKVIVHNRTKKEIERTFPLLVGYIFLAMPTEASHRHWGLLRECDGVKGALPHGRPAQALPSNAVETLRLAEAEERLRFNAVRRRRMTGKHSFQAGDDVRIAAGPFSGFVGQVTDAASRSAIRLLISVFGGLNAVSVPVDALEEFA